MVNPQTLVFFGRSGCGKGTQADLLIKYFAKLEPTRKTLFIETGKLLRELGGANTITGKMTKAVLDKGGLQPEFLPIYLWAGRLVNDYTGDEHIICDGVSRRLPEAPVLASAFQFYERKNPHIVLIDVSKKWSMERLLARGRSDDAEAEINRRLAWFEENTMPAVNYFAGLDYFNFHKINGEQSIENVHKDIIKAIGLGNE